MKNLPTAIVSDKTVKRLKSGYPWVLRIDLAQPDLKAYAAGGMVDFIGADGMFGARGFLHPKSLIAGRALTRYSHENIDDEFWRKRLVAALEKRAGFPAPYYRLVHAESDGFPGLIIDRYGDILVAQVNTAGMDNIWPQIEKIIIEVVKPKGLLLRNDSETRTLEGLDTYTRVSYGDVPYTVRISENVANFNVDIMAGQKTGWFFDQRDNRAAVAALSKGKSVIDVFCHTGGFGVTAGVFGASSVLFVDSSASALAKAKENAVLNKIDGKCAFMEGKAFDVLEKLASEGKTFDIVCLDPPSFIKSRQDIGAGLRGYQKLARLGAPLVVKGGHMFFASCSHHAGLKELIRNVGDGLKKSGRAFELLKTSGAGADHPVHPMLPETGYLKGLLYKLD